MNFEVIHIDETDSTNHWLRRHGDGRGECVVVAEYQTAGRGCGRNSWESERGRNLTFSLLLHLDGILAKQQFYISEVVSVALCRTLEQYVGAAEIKWPNDIYVDDRKICGMLIENRLQGERIVESIVGIGLNVNQRVFLSDASNPVSLWQLTNRETDREELLQAFLTALSEAMSAPMHVSAEYRRRLYRRSGYYQFRDAAGCFMATIDSVEPDGHLVLKDEADRRRVYAFKEVSFIIKE